MTSSNKSDAAPVGGMKGFFLKAGKSFYAGATVGREWSWWLIQKGGTVGLFLASTSMVILMPLIFEINREVQVCDGVASRYIATMLNGTAQNMQ